MDQKQKRVIVAITGASGGVVGIRTVEILSELGIETHLIISPAGQISLEHELLEDLHQLKKRASFVYDPADISAKIASGSYPIDAMIIVPCSVKTLSSIANSFSDNLISRSADVCLKEGRPLILGFRESPIHRGHIRLMDLAAQSGAIIFPLIPPFYGHPSTLSDLVNALVGRILLRCGIENPYYIRWDHEKSD